MTGHGGEAAPDEQATETRGVDTDPTRPDYERYPYSGYAAHEVWAGNGGSIVNGRPWGWL